MWEIGEWYWKVTTPNANSEESRLVNSAAMGDALNPLISLISAALVLIGLVYTIRDFRSAREEFKKSANELERSRKLQESSIRNIDLDSAIKYSYKKLEGIFGESVVLRPVFVDKYNKPQVVEADNLMKLGECLAINADSTKHYERKPISAVDMLQRPISGSEYVRYGFHEDKDGPYTKLQYIDQIDACFVEDLLDGGIETWELIKEASSSLGMGESVRKYSKLLGGMFFFGIHDLPFVRVEKKPEDKETIVVIDGDNEFYLIPFTQYSPISPRYSKFINSIR